ncbi:hypothetical protein SLEP1_g52666 [Rubroshorea leprosula]|uniref:Reverse transcriptase domain-containing protein n=1 Tax=Rubroshorea leprosula TaxID=152421 RepID=A0AAV5M838_9ROSI|nr:hypothetical protein SLEP1_g52666 [Rubroshorea leprosula]
MLQQKSSKAWLANGNANTKFFHNCVKGRWKRNEMNSIHVKGVQITEANKLKEEIATFFEETFTEEQWMRPSLEALQFKQTSLADNDFLTASFTEEEIKTVVWDCESSKVPGPDGFNFKFIKSEWETIKGDAIEVLHEFQKNGKLVKALNTSFIVFVPKVENPQKIEEYRPISLIGGMYKILAKLLANQLKKVLAGKVGEQQMAFLSGWQLMDGVVIANEVIDEVKKKKKDAFLFKIDFEKAYDKVSRRFLEFMLQKTGFSNTWRKWIMECLSSSMVSVLVNGSPTRQFTISRGLQQGDPLSPLLFLIIAEGINGLVLNVVDKGLLEGVEVGDKGFKVTHLQYADDTLLFGTVTDENVWAMKSILRTFELVSGLKINFNKSQLIGIEGVTKKLSTWKGRYLSLGGRITLINSVLFSLPVFWMSVNMIPKEIWQGWEPRYNWLREGNGFESRWWRDICRLNVTDKENEGWLAKGLRIKIGEGDSVKFWWDDWCGRGILANKYPRLYLISVGKDNTVSQMGWWLNGIWIWKLQWRKRLYSWEVQEEAEILKEIQETTITRGKTDVWEWIHSNNGVYTTRSAYKALTMELKREQLGVTLQKVWNAMVPNKVSAFSWQLLQDKIPTKANLLKRGIIQNMEDCKCEFCGHQIEETSHIFTHYKVAYYLWNACFRWWGFRTALDKEGFWLARNDSIFKEKKLTNAGPGILLKRCCSKEKANRVTIPE